LSRNPVAPGWEAVIHQRKTANTLNYRRTIARKSSNSAVLISAVSKWGAKGDR
jgi:hypothetical protein